MTTEQLDALTHSLSPALADQRERLRHERRGGERLRAPGAGSKDKLSDSDRILATVLCLRRIGTHELLARLFGVATSTLTRAVQEVRPLLTDTAIPASTARFRTPTDVAAHLNKYGNQPPGKIKSAC
ncbi:Helix-turn-helix of DDE superfamily endonuclease [Streptomyces noursei ATCC 11455]|nr:Helix-turn-helix of DDE superfamily endonuclease [Streptomyces noursei ATCC 11455]